MSNYKARIIGGMFKRRIIRVPDCPQIVRPTSDALRELIFNVLENSFYINMQEYNIVDICAGSGSFGLEALSRGAKHCSFIENNSISMNCIKENIKSLNLENKCKILDTDINLFNLKNIIEHKTIIFADPPYANKHILKKIANDLADLKSETICIFESDEEISYLNADLVKKRGKSIVSFFKYNTQQSEDV